MNERSEEYKSRKIFIRVPTMSNSFQRTFQHLLASNGLLHGPPPLQPAPSIRPKIPQPPSLHQPTILQPPSSQQLTIPQPPTLLQPTNLQPPSSQQLTIPQPPTLQQPTTLQPPSSQQLTIPQPPTLQQPTNLQPPSSQSQQLTIPQPPTLQQQNPPPPPPPGVPPQPSSSPTALTFIESFRKKPKLVHDGYSYTYHARRGNGMVAWRCDLNNKAARVKGTSCNSTALTTGTSPSSTLEYTKPHSHPPDPAHIGARKIRNLVKAAAYRDVSSTPHSIVASSLSNVDQDVQLSLPIPLTLKRSIQRKRKTDAISVNPDLALACDRSLDLLYIPPSLLQSWKHFDSGPGSDRIIIFTTDSNLDLLCQSERWCGDGTFKAAPKLWTQLYTIHGQKNGFTVPCVFALLPNKLKRSYRRLFNQIRTWIDVTHQRWNFDVFLSDFEQGAYTAVAEVFPGVGNDGCFFHLSKRLDYHVKQH